MEKGRTLPAPPSRDPLTMMVGYRLTVVLNEISAWSWHVVDLLAELGIEVATVHVPGADGPQLCDRQADERVDGSTLRVAMRLRALLAHNRSEALLCLYSGRYAFVGALATLGNAQPELFLYVAGSDATNEIGAKPFRWMYRLIRRWTFKRADLILANGEHLRCLLLGISERLDPQVWLHGIATPTIVGKQSDRRVVRLFAPRPWKSVYNNEQLIDALDLLHPAECHGVEVIINGLYMPEGTRRRLCSLNERISIIVLDGYAFNDRYTYFADSTHVISMARSDGVPNAVLEGAYAGCGLILGDITATRELVASSGLYAHLVPLDSPEALAGALRECWLNPAVFERCAVENARLVERTFGPDRAKDEFSRILVGHFTKARPTARQRDRRQR